MLRPPPSDPSESQVTALLKDWQAGDEGARDRLMPLLYNELHGLARARLAGEGQGHTLQPTALVHELYIKLIGQDRAHWNNRVHFLNVAAQMMRRILIDHARARDARKRGRDHERVALQEMDVALGGRLCNRVDILALEAALEDLETEDPRLGRIVELRFFAGLTISEAATALEISIPTVKRDWTTAKAWLWDRLHGD